jgi:hypothetical protein
MTHALTNNLFNLCCSELEEVGYLEAVLMEDKIVYHEHLHAFREAGLSMSDPGLSISILSPILKLDKLGVIQTCS